MAMSKRAARQQELWIETERLAPGPGHPFYSRLNEILKEHGFDTFVEDLCQRFYAEVMGRPSLAPGIYFRMLLIGFLEGLGSERGVAWRVSDSFSLREFLGLRLTEATPNHSTLSRTRKRIDLETHEQVFAWVLQVLAKHGLLKGKTFGIDGSTLEANAAMRNIHLKETGESYNEFLTRLAEASGIETPTREDLARFDRKRKKKCSNKDWEHPHDPDAKIAKMKDGRTHMAHKAEHATDMETGALVAVTIHGADQGDTTTIHKTEEEVLNVLADVMEDPEAAAQLSDQLCAEVVADKGYHSNAVLVAHKRKGIRSYISEQKRGKRRWKGKLEEKEATYANRRRIRGKRGKELMRQRGEKVERTFAHCYETGGMRRTHVRGHENILKRLLICAAGYNLSLLMRKLYSVGKPRRLQGLSALLSTLYSLLQRLYRAIWPPFRFQMAIFPH